MTTLIKLQLTTVQAVPLQSINHTVEPKRSLQSAADLIQSHGSNQKLCTQSTCHCLSKRYEMFLVSRAMLSALKNHLRRYFQLAA